MAEENKMQALKRKPNLDVQDRMTLTDGTVIEKIGIRARKQMEIANNKRLSDYDKGVHITAAQVLINGQEVVADDLLDCFTGPELMTIINWVNPDLEEKEGAEKNG
jgi:hypothetical protein